MVLYLMNDGIDINELEKYKQDNKYNIRIFLMLKKIQSPSDLLTYDCDILIPAALENAITLKNVENIKARIICEAANGPISYRADQKIE